MSKLKFRVVHMSSEDSGYPASELNTHSPSTRGWQSDKFCQFPQELGFELLRGEARLSQVQVLSHQSKIATKMELFVGQGSDYHSAKWKRLGYLSLDSNERSSFQARELKTVYIDQVGRFVKLVVHKNYVNKQNMFNQVGVVALNLLGSDSTASTGSLGGDSQFSSNPLNDLSIDMNLDPSTAERLRLLSDAKARAVATEDYVTAKKIKAVEGELKTLGAQLAQLDMAKRVAVADEDYDKAKEIKDEVDSLKNEIEQKILAIQIPGVTDGPRDLRIAQPRAQPKHLSPDAHMGRGSPGAQAPGAFFGETKASGSRGAPLNIDDMPVGRGGGGGGAYDDDAAADARFSSAQGRRRSPRGGDGDGAKGGGGGGGGDYDDAGFDDEREEGKGGSRSGTGVSPVRQIRPKATELYNDRDPFIGEEGDPDDSVPASFPPGQHPLENVLNFQELSAPEALRGKSREVSEAAGITALVGEYRASCLFSKAWALREAATQKIQMMLTEGDDGGFENAPGISACLPTMAAIVKVGVEDKIQQVFFSTIALMDAVLASTRRAKLPRSTVAPMMDPVVSILIEKLADGNARIREGARKGLEVLAGSSNVGPPVVGAHALRALPSKQASAWRPISSRLQLLTDLVSAYGVGGGTGLSTESVMNYAKNTGAFAHSNAEVRDSAKELTVAVQAVVGTEALEGYLKALRPKQLEEYMAAFEGKDAPGAAPGGGGGAGHAAAQPKQRHAEHHTPDHKADHKADHKPSGGKHAQSKGSAASPKTPKDPHGKGDKAGAGGANPDAPADFTTCMFCGATDKKWNEDALDLHYWKDCALLAPCPACAQVVEIAGLPEHLLDECDQKASYAPCEVTGLAIRSNEMATWSKSPKCTPAPANCMYCPLCLESVEDTNDAWKDHLMHTCAENKRRT